MRWSLRQIEVFIAIVEERGFSAAASRLSLAQPAVSIAVRKLEASLGVKLFSREGRGMQLTQEGTTFLRHARAMLAQMADAQREITELKSLQSGRVVIGAPPMVAAYLLPSIVEDFLADHPGVRIEVVQAGADVVANKVRNGELDLGFVAEWQTADGLETLLIERHPIVACIVAHSPLARSRQMSWEALLDQPLVLFPKGYHQRSRIDEAAGRLRKQPHIVFEAESVELIAAVVRAGRGVATLLAAAARSLTGIVALALPDDARVPIALCRRRGPLSSIAATAFSEIVEQRHRRSAGWAQKSKRRSNKRK